MIFISNIKKNHSPAIFLILLVAVIPWVKTLFSNTPGIYVEGETSVLYDYVSGILGGADCGIICKLLALAMVFVQAILINAVTNRYRLITNKSFLPGLLYLLLIANMPNLHMLHAILFGNCLIILSWMLVVNIFNQSENNKTVFNAAFILGIASLFYPLHIYFLLLIFAAIWISNTESLRTFIIAIIGFATVWYLYLSINYLLNGSLPLKGINIGFRNQAFNFSSKTYYFYALIIFLILLFVGSFPIILSHITSNKIFIRRNIQLLFVWLFIAIMLLLISTAHEEIIYELAIPFSIFMTIAFVNIKNRWIREGLWLIFLLITILNQTYLF